MKVYFKDGTYRSFDGFFSFDVEGDWLVAKNTNAALYFSAHSVNYIEY